MVLLFLSSHSFCTVNLIFKVLSYYFNGIFTSTELADLEFISLSKVYTIKKSYWIFKENDYLKNKEIIIPEFDSRNILLALVRYVNWEGYENKNPYVEEACNELIDYVETHFLKEDIRKMKSPLSYEE